MRYLRVKSNYFLNISFGCSKEPSLRSKMQKTLCDQLLLFGESSPTADQFNLIMFDNLYVKHNFSNFGDENKLKY